MNSTKATIKSNKRSVPLSPKKGLITTMCNFLIIHIAGSSSGMCAILLLFNIYLPHIFDKVLQDENIGIQIYGVSVNNPQFGMQMRHKL